MRNELSLGLTRDEIELCESRSSRHSPAHAPRPPNPSVRRKRHESAMNRVMGPTALLLVNALKSGSLPRRPGIGHGPHSAVPGVVFIPIPRRTTNVQMGVRRAGEHHHRASVPHHGAKPSSLRIERPEDHPMGTDRDRGTGCVEGIRVAVLRCSIEHVDQTRRRVGRLWLPCQRVLQPHHPHRVDAHVRPANDVLVAGDTDPVVCPRTENGHVAIPIHLRHGRFACDTGGTCEHGASDFLLFDFFRHDSLFRFALRFVVHDSPLFLLRDYG